MITFDEVLPAIHEVLTSHKERLSGIGQLLVNRDLNSRVRLIVSDGLRAKAPALETLHAISADLMNRLGKRAYPVEQSVLYEPDLAVAYGGASKFALPGFTDIWVLDRLVTGTDWTDISAQSSSIPRIIFFSIKGGVGRSTALAATAWSLAQAGKRVLVMDLDLESPGLSSSLLPEDRRPAYGITDWLVEDLVDNSDAVFQDMFASSDLSRDGEIYIVPAHGCEPGEYIAKLGRAWMSKRCADGTMEAWSQRLQRLLNSLEERFAPDVVLIDSRAGIDEVAASSVARLGASLVLLFAMEGPQTWTGYRMLFEHWRQRGVANEIRDRLQIVGAMLPELEQFTYLESLRDHAYALFAGSLYDDIPAGSMIENQWHFEATDEVAPHYPWAVKWHRSFAGLRSLQGRLAVIDAQEVHSIFGPLIKGVNVTLGGDD